jgi:cbb3-type cytochrome oxidase subunit 3
MIQNILRHLGGIEHYGIISLFLFGAVFIGVLIWAFIQKKTHLDYMARVALDPEVENNHTGDLAHE